jgi:hypothetical protein
MISRDLLNDVRTLVTHADCADGMASAILLADALPDRRVVFVQHNTPDYTTLPAEPGMLFCDIVPPPTRVDEFVEAGAIVLDHHRGAKDIVGQFGDRGVFADETAEPGVSGAMLAFREVWLAIYDAAPADTIRRAQRFATLAGIRDTWQNTDPRWKEACAHAAALRFWPWGRLRGLTWLTLEDRLTIGELLLQKDEERDTRTITEAYRFTANGIGVMVFEGIQTSDISERMAHEIDLVMGWHYQVVRGRPEMVVSCRSRGGFSCLPLAKRYGGGGHAHAAGFRIDVDRMKSPNPYEHLRTLVDEHMAKEGVYVKERS